MSTGKVSVIGNGTTIDTDLLPKPNELVAEYEFIRCTKEENEKLIQEITIRLKRMRRWQAHKC